MTAERLLDIAKHLEWSEYRSACTMSRNDIAMRWKSCPSCSGVKPIHRDEENWFPLQAIGHRPYCELAEIIRSLESACVTA